MVVVYGYFQCYYLIFELKLTAIIVERVVVKTILLNIFQGYSVYRVTVSSCFVNEQEDLLPQLKMKHMFLSMYQLLRQNFATIITVNMNVRKLFE